MSEQIKLTKDSEPVRYLSSKDRRRAKLMHMVGDISCQVYQDSYLFLVNQIVCQMLSKKAGKSIFRHLSEICEGTVTAESITCLTDEEIKSSGISKSKVKFIRELTRAVSDGSLNFEHISELDDESALKQFMKIYGIGRWSAKMYLIFVLNRPDILPFEDATFLQVYDWMYKTEDNAPASVIKKCQKWKPYSSIAAICTVPWIWDLPKKFHLYKQEGI